MNRLTASAAAPLELPRLVMRRASWVALAALLLALALGLWRGAADIDEETRSAMALATALAGIVDGAERDEAELQATLQRLRSDDGLRHVRLTLRDAQSRVVFDSAAAPSAQGASLAWWGWLDRPWQRDVAPPLQRINLPRPLGADWSLDVTPARDSERREALTGLLQMLATVALGSAAMLAVMAWNMRRAFAPLRSLLDAIEGMRTDGARAASTALAAPMPIRELQSISQALHGLQEALHGEATQRRLLSQQLLTLQEDERQRLARELHDEFGQQLTGLRVDAVWLAQRLAGEPQQQRVAQAIAERCGAIQQDIRALLTRLQPLAASAGHEPASRLAELLQALVHGWGRSATQPCAFELRLVTQRADGREVPWPAIDDDAALLPRELALAIYRISQEALTNVARHAQATRAVLSLAWCVDADGRVQAIDWVLGDDGVGLPDPAQALQRGTGLAGLKERAWAQGAELEFSAARPRGLRLAARFAVSGAA
jgi:two-component system, NarL family, sensor histidine kinase UhpB